MNSLPIYCLGCLFVFLAVSCHSPEEPGSTQTREPAYEEMPVDESRSTSEQLAKVIQEYEDQRLQFRQNQPAKTVANLPGNKPEQVGLPPPDPEVYADRLIGIIQSNQSDLANLKGIRWILREIPSGSPRQAAIERLQTDYLETEEIADLLPVLVDGYPDRASMQLIEQLAKNSRHLRVQAVAKMARIKGHQAILRFVHFLDNPKWTDRMKSFVDESTLEFYRAVTARDVDLESHLQELNPLSIYGDYDFGAKTKGRPVQNIGQMATEMLFSLQHLQVGKPAPNIEAEDLDGLTFSLTEYRGKIVMLDFWGDW